jgi:anti-sigma-K factor RskA
VLVVTGLKPLPAGNTYEFWLIKDSAAVPAGLFKVDEQGQGVLQVTQSLASNSFNAIGVSIEPAGGSQQPTGDIVMLGKLND